MNKNSILIAEDDIFLIKVLKKQFENNHFEVYTADNGNTALQLYEKYNPLAVLMDIDMPEKNGLEVLQKIRGQNKKIPIFIMTGQKTEEEDSLSSYKMGATIFIRKPFSTKEIAALIDNQIKSIYELPEILTFGKLVLNMSTLLLTTSKEEYKLSDRKAKILYLLVKNIDKLVSKEEIHKIVWQRYEIANQQMVKNTINSLRNILQTEGLNIEAVYSGGYRLRSYP